MNPLELRTFLNKFVPEMNALLDSRIHKAMLCDGSDVTYRALLECKQAYQQLIERLQVDAHSERHGTNT
jgi:hypothetical protein